MHDNQQHPQHRHHWQLDPSLIFLNHGSFGATPTVVLEAQRHLRDQLEADPICFLAPERELEPKLDRIRNRIAKSVNTEARNLVFVRNSTDGVNAVVNSLPFGENDEFLHTNFGYNACNNAIRFAAERKGASVRCIVLPFPVQDPQQIVNAIGNAIGPRSKWLLIDHVTSGTALVFPIQEIVDFAKAKGLRVMVDGAHAPGMLPVDLNQLAPDYYTANHHKWLCGPKASGFLYVREELQSEVHPTVISHGMYRERPDRSPFFDQFDWPGTYDPTPILAMDAALDVVETLLPGGLPELQTRNRQLALAARHLLLDVLKTEPTAPETMVGSMATVLLPPQLDHALIQADLRNRFNIEVPVHGNLLRISAHAYNQQDDYETLASALKTRLQESRK